MDLKTFNGNRLREALSFRGKKITELADETGIKKQSISAYCNGTNKPPAENVWKMANFLKFPFQYFFQADAPTVTTKTTYFRSQAVATKKSKDQQNEKMDAVARLYDFLVTNYINFPAMDLPEFDIDLESDSATTDSEETLLQIEAAADYLREYWGMGRGPIDNIQYALESHGIIVTGFPVEDDDKIDAFSEKIKLTEGGEVFIVALGIKSKPIQRLRFDMCHELGHIVLHPWEKSEDKLTRDEFNAIEKQANMFAGAFLLPRETFLADIGPYATDLSYYRMLKGKWNVSMQAMVYRAWQIKAITYNQFQYMMRQFSKLGYRKREPGDKPADINNTMFKAALEMLFNEGYLTPETFMAQLYDANIALGEEDLEELMHLEPGTLKTEETRRTLKIITLKPQAEDG